MLKLAGEMLEGELYEHQTQLDAHTRNSLGILRTGEYHQSYGAARGNASVGIAANTLTAMPFIVPRNMSFDRIAIDVTALAAGKSVRLGIYRDGINVYPGSLLLDAGMVDASTVGIKAVIIDRALTKGLYWLAALSDGTPSLAHQYAQPNPLGMISSTFVYSNSGWAVAQAYGALPDPFPAGGSAESGWRPVVLLRLASLD